MPTDKRRPADPAEHTRLMLDLLDNERGEMRIISLSGYTRRFHFNDRAHAVQQAQHFSKQVWSSGVYATFNELDPRIDNLPSINGPALNGSCIKKVMVTHYRHLVLDLDWNKPEKFKDPASDEEHAGVLRLGERGRDMMFTLRWPEPLWMDSGNGCYLIYRLPDLPNVPRIERGIKRLLRACAARLDGPEGHVDQSVGDPGRIIRLGGTQNRKGTATEERPYRQTRILSAPDVLQPVSVEKLDALASEVPDDEPRPKRKGRAKSKPKQPVSDAAIDGLVEVVCKYLTEHNAPPFRVVVQPDKTKVEFAYCPFVERRHDRATAAVLVYPNGTIAFKCFAEKCSDKDWYQLQRMLTDVR